MPATMALTVLIATSLSAGLAMTCAAMMRKQIKTVPVRTGRRRAD